MVLIQTVHNTVDRRRGAQRLRARGGFTLLESLMAAGILLVVVVAVSSAVVAGHQHSREAQDRIAGTLAAEEMLARLVAREYDDLPAWNGYTEHPGQMTDISGESFPEAFNKIGRRVRIISGLRTMPGVSAKVYGREVQVMAFVPARGSVAQVNCFIPQPIEDSIPEVEDDGGLLEWLLN